MNMNKKTIGKWAFLTGFFGAILLGLMTGFDVWTAGTWYYTILVIAGLAIGFLNITKGEGTKMVVSALVLGAGGGILAVLPAIGGVLEAIVSAFAWVFIPTAIVIAVMNFWKGGK